MRVSATRVFIAAALATVIGPEANGASKSEYANVHTVEVISALGDDITMRKHGPTIFGNLEYPLHADWHVDEIVASAIQSALGSRFEIKTVPEHISAFSGIGNIGLIDGGEVRRKLANLSGDSAPDVYLLVTPLPDIVDRFPTGLAIKREPGLVGEGYTAAYGYYKIDAFDARTGNRIDYGTSQWPTTRTLTGHEPPIEGCSNDIWADSAEELTDEQRTRIRQEMSFLITRSMAYTLASAGFMDKNSADEITAASAAKSDASCHH